MLFVPWFFEKNPKRKKVSTFVWFCVPNSIEFSVALLKSFAALAVGFCWLLFCSLFGLALALLIISREAPDDSLIH
jgi:hypothetical protein